MQLVLSIFILLVLIGCSLEIIKAKNTNPFAKNTNYFDWKAIIITLLPIIIIQFSLNQSVDQLFNIISLLFSFGLTCLLTLFIKPIFPQLKSNLLLFGLVLIFSLLFQNHDSINSIILMSLIGTVIAQFTLNPTNHKTNFNLIAPSLLYLTGLYWIINNNFSASIIYCSLSS